ncbi:hypothetical protein B0F90DRAFT_1811200 [Multifurca ochricompacta]|uniref:Uncharacterized protein n=1 Tax=Multifurca ochricompacta TaxID=376703 RepID=A0AAD4M0M0_9AGAM|nr:hypothetical protein B0F90DRAFT_1811200 [Multifurca ochricompacta]
MRSVALFAFALALAGQALNVVIGGSIGNITADNFLTVQDDSLTSQCQSSCGPATTAIKACNGDDTCLCSNNTVTAITSCQQCYFTTIIEENRKVSDPRAGSTPALAAYVAACKAPPVNITVPATEVALTLPSGWDGPTDVGLNLGETIGYVAGGAIIGVGSIVILCTM